MSIHNYPIPHANKRKPSTRDADFVLYVYAIEDIKHVAAKLIDKRSTLSHTRTITSDQQEVWQRQVECVTCCLEAIKTSNLPKHYRPTFTERNRPKTPKLVVEVFANDEVRTGLVDLVSKSSSKNHVDFCKETLKLVVPLWEQADRFRFSWKREEHKSSQVHEIFAQLNEQIVKRISLAA